MTRPIAASKLVLIADCRGGDAALTRVAPAGSLIVNSSRGGGAKDTWILGHD